MRVVQAVVEIADVVLAALLVVVLVVLPLVEADAQDVVVAVAQLRDQQHARDAEVLAVVQPVVLIAPTDVVPVVLVVLIVAGLHVVVAVVLLVEMVVPALVLVVVVHRVTILAVVHALVVVITHVTDLARGHVRGIVKDVVLVEGNVELNVQEDALVHVRKCVLMIALAVVRLHVIRVAIQHAKTLARGHVQEHVKLIAHHAQDVVVHV